MSTTSSRTLRITYTGDASGVLGAIKQIETSSLNLGDKMRVVGQKMSSAGRSMTVGLTLPLVGIGVAAVKTAADFEKTMNTMGAVAGVPAPELEKLRKLAIDLGAKTAFSANEAAEGMLELAKAGISTADIMGGALENSLNLATAGELELGDAARTTSNAMNVFSLRGKESAQAADALAGAANASSADVADLTLALSQGGLAAANAGLTIQETTAALAAFADAGLRGSDAGTSLKTFLLNLVPTSVRAREAMAELGLSFIDNEGNIKSLTGIADELQEGLEGLTQAEQQAALKIIFGTDAFRAATIVANEGAEGLRGYIKATSDSGSAAEVAAAKMKGLPGALETLRGAAETAALALGDALSPIVQDVAGRLTQLAGKFTALSPATQETIVKIGLVVAALGPVLFIAGKVTTAIGALVTAFTGLGGAIVAHPIAAAVVGIAVGVGMLAKAAADTEARIQALTQSLLEGQTTIREEADVIADTTVKFSRLGPKVSEAGLAYGELREAQERANEIIRENISGIIEAAGAHKSMTDAIVHTENATYKERTALAQALETLSKLTGGLHENVKETVRNYLEQGHLTSALDFLERQIQGTFGPLKNLSTQQEHAAEAAADHAQKTKAATAALRENERAASGGVGALRNWMSAAQVAAEAAADLAQRVQYANSQLAATPSGGGGRRGGGGPTGLQHGGIVTRPTLALIGEAGPEAVIPLSKPGGVGGPTVHIHIGTVVGPGGIQEVAEMIRRELQKTGVRNVSVGF